MGKKIFPYPKIIMKTVFKHTFSDACSKTHLKINGSKAEQLMVLKYYLVANIITLGGCKKFPTKPVYRLFNSFK